MAVSEAQKRANAEYRKKNTKTVSIRFFPSEKDIFDHMDKQGGRATYIKRLIREDMERGNR